MSGPRSHEIFTRAQELFPGGVNSPVRAFRSVDSEPFVVQRGEGAYLYDVDGKRYVDYINSWGPLVLGHAHPAIVQALAEQAAKGTSYGACSEVEVQLAEIVRALMPRIEMLRFVNSGTEAGMSVVRLARAFTKRSKILKFDGCYHGHVDALLVRAGSGLATLGIPDCAGVLTTTTSDTLSAGFNDLEAVRRCFKEQGENIAAVILEPVVGNAGLLIPDRGFLAGLREITAANGALLIFDEVMTGFRVDLAGAQGLFDITPDLTMLGKVIGGGLPVGAFGGRRDIMELLAPVGPVYQAGTLSGNPLAMRAGIATLQLWSADDRFETTAECARALMGEMRNAAERHGIPLFAASLGTMFGFFFHPGPVRDFAAAREADAARFKRFFNLMLDRGIYFAPSPFEAGFVSAAHPGAAFEQTVTALHEVFAAL